MRVVAGVAGGRRLRSPAGRSTRPTSDRVREAIFNALGSMGPIEGATVLDLFAGSGALGIEALSRGAAHATFVDRDHRAVQLVRANLRETGLGHLATVVQGDARRYVAEHPESVDVAFLDPPYAWTDDEWGAVLGELVAGRLVIESDREVTVPAPWEVHRSKKYGGTVVILATRRQGER